MKFPASPSLSRTWICHWKMFENNMLSISVNFIRTDRRVLIAPIGVQPDKNFSFGKKLQNKATSLLSSCLVVQSGLSTIRLYYDVHIATYQQKWV